MEELIKEGYLCPLQYIDKTILDHEQIKTNVTKSNFDLEKYWKQVEPQKNSIVEGIAWASQNHTSVLVFCSSVLEAETLSKEVPGSHVVTGKTPKKERAAIITKFKNKEFKVLFNVEVLTVGFDYPALDCIVLNRPTKSFRLYQQLLGRGTRPSLGKTHCTVLDYSGTVNSLGKIETIKIEKVDGKWDLISEKGSWHGRELYSFKVQKQ